MEVGFLDTVVDSDAVHCGDVDEVATDSDVKALDILLGIHQEICDLGLSEDSSSLVPAVVQGGSAVNAGASVKVSVDPSDIECTDIYDTLSVPEVVAIILPVVFLLVIVCYVLFALLAWKDMISLPGVSTLELLKMVKDIGIALSSLTAVFLLMTLSYYSGKKVSKREQLCDVERLINAEKKKLIRAKEEFVNYRSEMLNSIDNQIRELNLALSSAGKGDNLRGKRKYGKRKSKSRLNLK